MIVNLIYRKFKYHHFNGFCLTLLVDYFMSHTKFVMIKGPRTRFVRYLINENSWVVQIFNEFLSVSFYIFPFFILSIFCIDFIYKFAFKI